MSIKAYWECDKCGYFIAVDDLQHYFYIENTLDQLTAPCENPACDGVMRLKATLK